MLFNRFFYFILLATANSFAYVNSFTLACFGKTIPELIGSLECECKIALNWFNENKITVTPGKCQARIMDMRKQEHGNIILKIGSKEIEVASQIKLLRVEIYNKLHLEQHINCICKLVVNLIETF